jgi:hypothetical protein
MVMMIGLITMMALVWVLASSMARESDAEKRRMNMHLRYGLPHTLTDVCEEEKKAA